MHNGARRFFFQTLLLLLPRASKAVGNFSCTALVAFVFFTFWDHGRLAGQSIDIERLTGLSLFFLFLMSRIA